MHGCITTITTKMHYREILYVKISSVVSVVSHPDKTLFKGKRDVRLAREVMNDYIHLIWRVLCVNTPLGHGVANARKEIATVDRQVSI